MPRRLQQGLHFPNTVMTSLANLLSGYMALNGEGNICHKVSCSLLQINSTFFFLLVVFVCRFHHSEGPNITFPPWKVLKTSV